MTLPASGQITMSQINEELQRPANTPINLNETIVRGLAGRMSGQIAMSDFHGKSYVVTATLSGYTTTGRYNLDQLFTEHDRKYKKCILNVSACKLGGGDRTWGSLHSASNDWHDLTINLSGGTYIAGAGGNGEARSGGCGGGQGRGDGGHGITFLAGTNARVNIPADCAVGGGGAGGQAGWHVACGYTNSGVGGAGGGGAGFPAGVGGPHGSVSNGNCFCDANRNRGQNGNEWNGGECGYATGFGNGCETGGYAAAQHGSRGGALGQRASRKDGCYPIGDHGNAGSAIVNARSVRSDDGAGVFGLVNGLNVRNFDETMTAAEIIEYPDHDEDNPRIVSFFGMPSSDVATIPMDENDMMDEEYEYEECGDCTPLEVSDLV